MISPPTGHANAAQPSLLRSRQGQEHARVSFIELFFDLVFVFAITQLSHSLMAHFSAIGAVQTLMLLLAVWWVWIFTSWVTNWLDPEQLPVRMALLVLMVLGLILSASLPRAFDERGLVFGGAYAAMQVGRTLFFLWAVRGHAVLVRNFQRILMWFVLGAAFWIAGGVALGPARLCFWGVALGLEYVSPSLYFWVPGLGRATTRDWDIEGGHLAERCALFIIIALGESILVTGATFGEMEWSSSTVAAFIVSLIGSIAMWWLYFDTAAEAGSHRIVHSDDPGRMGRLAYTYIHLFMVAGIVVSAVADEFVLHHSTGHADAKTLITVLGGTALYLLGNMLFKCTVVGRLPWSHLAGMAALTALVPVAEHLSSCLLSAFAALVLVAIAVWERLRSALLKV